MLFNPLPHPGEIWFLTDWIYLFVPTSYNKISNLSLLILTKSYALPTAPDFKGLGKLNIYIKISQQQKAREYKSILHKM